MQRHWSKKLKTHISMDQFKADLQAAINKVLPSPQPVFSEAILVTLNWTECDFDDSTATDDLINTFKDVYNIDHKRINLDSSKYWVDVRIDLSEKLHAIDFDTLPSKNDDSCRLVIIYYSGHATADVNKKDIRILYAIHTAPTCMPDTNERHSGQQNQYGGRNAPILSWKSVASMMGEFRGYRRVVHILDCYNAGMAALDLDITTMCACAWESTASGDWDTSFTTMLTEQIRAEKGASLSPADLMGHILGRSKTVHEGSQPILRTPKNDEGPPIMFHKMADKNGPAPSIPPPPSGKDRPLITVKVMMDNDLDTHDLTAFKVWLTTNIPNGIGTIDIAAKWKTTSTALQFIMPAAVWLALPDNDSEAYQYQGLYLGDYESFPLQKLDSSGVEASV